MDKIIDFYLKLCYNKIKLGEDNRGQVENGIEKQRSSEY